MYARATTYTRLHLTSQYQLRILTIFFYTDRLRAAPLFQLNPSREKEKTLVSEKWPRENWGHDERAGKEGLQTKPKRMHRHGRVIFRHQILLLLAPCQPTCHRNAGDLTWLKPFFSATRS